MNYIRPEPYATHMADPLTTGISLTALAIFHRDGMD
jgi:hypothetical protein